MYDNADHMQSITSRANGGTVFTAAYARDPNGQVTSHSSASAQVDAYRYTQLNQLCYAGSSSTNSCTNPPAGSASYKYDAADNATTFSIAPTGTITLARWGVWRGHGHEPPLIPWADGQR